MCSRKLVFAAVLTAFILNQPTFGQSTYTWVGSGGGGTTTTWLNTADWTGGAGGTWPGVTATFNAANGNAGDIATFSLTANVNPVGINMNTAGGSFTLGAISLAGTTFVPTFGNNSTTFFPTTTLQLNNSGATTIAGFTNVLLNNSNTSGTMTFNSFNATNTPRMDIRLGSTTNVINITNAAAGITINSDIYEANAGTGFTLQGAGLLTLAGTGSSFTGPVTVAGEGRINVSNPGGLGSGTVTFNNTTDKSAVGAANLTIAAPGNVTRTFTNNFVLSTTGNTGFAITTAGGSGQIDTLSGVISGGGPGLKFALANTAAATPNGVFILANPSNSFTATVSIGSGTVGITSDGSLGNTANVVSLNVNDTGRGGLRFNADVSLAATRTVDVLTNSIVDTNGFNATIAGPVTNSGGGGLIKAGAGTLTLAGSADTLNNLTARQGTVVLDYTTNNDNKLDSAAAVTLQGATLRMNANAAGSAQSFAGLTVSQGGSSALAATGGGGTGAALNVGALARTAGGTLDFTLPAVGSIQTAAGNGATGLLFDGAMTVGKTDWATISAGAIAAFGGYAFKNDASTFSAGDHVSNTAAFTGTIPAGGLSIGSLRFNSAATGGITIGAGDTLTVATGGFGGILLTPAVTGVQQINGGSLTTTGTELIIQHYGAGELDIGSAITGAIGLTKSGPGRVVLSGANSYSAATVINSGTVGVASLTGTTNLGTGAVVLGNGTLEYTGASQSLARTVTLAGVHGPAGATISVTNPAATLTLAGVISGSQVSSLTKAGPGTLAVNVSNSAGYFGDTIVSNGTLTTNNLNGLGNAAATGRIVLGDANTGSSNVAFLLNLTTGSFPLVVVVSNQGTGTATFGVATGTAGGAVMNSEMVLGRSVVLQSPASGTLQFTNRITGTGDVIINSQGGGSINFFRAQGANVASDWVGNLILNANSTVLLGSSAGAINVDKSVPNTANVVFNTGSVMQLSPGSQLGYETVNALVSTLPGDGAVTQTAGTFQLTVGGGGGSGMFSGVISSAAGTLNVIKTGGGTQTFTGANTYTGTTTINGGTLLVNNTSGFGTGTGAVKVVGTGTLGSGGTLGGTGTISGLVTIGSTTAAAQGGIVSPGPGGTAAGTLNVGSMTWNPLSRYVFAHSATDVTTGGGVNNFLSGTGTLDLSALNGTSPFDLNLQPLSFAPTPTAQTYTIVDFASGITGAGGVPGVAFANGTDVSSLFTVSGTYTSATAPFAMVVGGPGGGADQAIQLTFVPAAPQGLSTWSGATSGNWSVANNWSPAAVPTSSPNTALTFGATANSAMTNDIAGTLTLNSMTFLAGSPAYTLGGNALNFATSTAGAAPTIVQNSSNGVIIGAAVTLTNTLTVSGPGNLTLGGTVGGPGGLTFNGTGRLTLGGANNYSGGTTVLNGTVVVAGDANLGTGNVTGASLGTLSFTGTTATTKSFTMNGGTVSVAAGKTLTFNGGTVAAAYLDGAGTFATGAAGATFTGVTAQPSVAVVSNSPADAFVHFTDGGALTVAAGLAAPVRFGGFTTQGSGSVTVGAGSQVNAANFQSYGTLTLNPAATGTTKLTNTGVSPLAFNIGSRTFISTAAQAGLGHFAAADLELNGQTAIVAGGLLVNNGEVTDSSAAGNAAIIADFGALVKGAGQYDNPVITRNGGRFQAGNSPGVAAFGRFVFGPGGVNSYVFAIDDATGTAGPRPNALGQVSGWGLVATQRFGQANGNTTTGDFAWTADSANKLTVALDTLVNPTTSGTDLPGPMADFDPTKAYSWLAVSWAGSYTGPADAASLDAATNFDASGFANPVAGSFGWNLDAAGRELSLVYSPTAVPEPGTLALVGLAAAGLAAWRRRRGVRPPGFVPPQDGR